MIAIKHGPRYLISSFILAYDRFCHLTFYFAILLHLEHYSLHWSIDFAILLACCTGIKTQVFDNCQNLWLMMSFMFVWNILERWRISRVCLKLITASNKFWSSVKFIFVPIEWQMKAVNIVCPPYKLYLIVFSNDFAEEWLVLHNITIKEKDRFKGQILSSNVIQYPILSTICILLILSIKHNSLEWSVYWWLHRTRSTHKHSSIIAGVII